jgi:hypothetical protein
VYTVLRVDLKDSNALVLACHADQVLAVAGQYQLGKVEFLLFWRGELDPLAGWLFGFVFLRFLQPQLLLDENVESADGQRAHINSHATYYCLATLLQPFRRPAIARLHYNLRSSCAEKSPYTRVCRRAAARDETLVRKLHVVAVQRTCRPSSRSTFPEPRCPISASVACGHSEQLQFSFCAERPRSTTNYFHH